MMKLKGIIFFSLFYGLSLSAQEIRLEPALIGPASGTGQTGDIHLSWSVGEPATTTETVTGFILTQGFLQPKVGEDVIMTFTTYPSTCLNSNDGAASLRTYNGTAPYTYSWTPAVSSTDTASGLAPGEYTVIVTDADGETDTVTFMVELLSEAGCELHIYNGITPNGDGHNEVWIIDGVATYSDNSVQLYNRWGDRVWMATGYNNADISWHGQNSQGQPLPEGTYFYIITITNKQFTGWVELTR